MIRVLQFLLHGCWHVWTTDSKHPYSWDYDGFSRGTGSIAECHCVKCGRHTAFKLK